MPRQWKPSEDRAFFLDAEQVSTLCDQAERAFAAEPTVLRLRGERPRGLQTWCFHSHVHGATQGWQYCGNTFPAGVALLRNGQTAEVPGGARCPAAAG